MSYALRLLRRSPAFTLVALLSLGLGIGANTAIFSLIDTVLVKTLPVEDPRGCSSSTTPAGSRAAAAARRIRASSASAITTASSRGSPPSTNGCSRCRSTACRSGCVASSLPAPTSRCSASAPTHGRLLTPPTMPSLVAAARRRRRGHQRRLLDAPVRKGTGRARQERAGRHAVGDHRRRDATRILRASGRHAARHHGADDVRRNRSAIDAELVAERDRASLARGDRRAGARGPRRRCGTPT